MHLILKFHAIDASAIAASLASGGSERLVNTIGTAPPKTKPAANPPAHQTRDLNRILPDTMSGTTSALALPATWLVIPFSTVAVGEIARSKDRGPKKSAAGLRKKKLLSLVGVQIFFFLRLNFGGAFYVSLLYFLSNFFLAYCRAGNLVRQEAVPLAETGESTVQLQSLKMGFKIFFTH